MLSKPLTRAQYVLGKVLGCGTFLLGYLLFCVWAITMLSLVYRLDTAITLPMVVQAFLGSLVLGVYGMMLATLMHPLLAGLVAYMLRGHVIHYVLLGLPTGKWYWAPLYLLHLLLPEDFGGLTRGLVPNHESPSLLIGAASAVGMLGAVGYCVLLTLAAIFLIRRQDLVGSSRG